MGSDQGLTHLFYDGGCAFCHRAVRFVAQRERSGRVHFAPLDGETYRRLVPPIEPGARPDSLLVRGPDGTLLWRSAALRHLLGRMGPGWRLAARLLACIPAGLRDRGYDWVARRRRTALACPMGSPPGDPRFEA